MTKAEKQYAAVNLADLFLQWNMPTSEINSLLNDIWMFDQEYLPEKYQANPRKLKLDVADCMHLLLNQESLVDESRAVKADMDGLGLTNGAICKIAEDGLPKDDQLFLAMRISLRFGYKKLIRLKMRTLLRYYGMKRRSSLIVQYITESLEAYHISARKRGGVWCALSEVGLDEMLTFRIADEVIAAPAKKVGKANQIASIQLITNHVFYGLAPAPEDEVEQHIIISASGDVQFVGMCYGKGYGSMVGEKHFIAGRHKRLEINPEIAGDVFGRIDKMICGLDKREMCTDCGDWELSVQYADASVKCFEGSCGCYTAEDTELCSLLQEIFPEISDVWGIA